MSDPSTMERYCSSYYDKHGLYNDGFPCPADKYCCQSDDGMKMCCAIGAEKSEEPPKQPQNSRHHHHHQKNVNKHNNPSSGLFQPTEPKANRADPSSFKSYVLTTLQSNLRQQQQQQQQQHLVKLTNFEQLGQDQQFNQYGMRPGNSLGSIEPSSPGVYGAATVPFFLSNSTLLITICIGLALLVLLSGLLIICICRCCMRKSVESQHQQQLQQHHARNGKKHKKKSLMAASGNYYRNSSSSSCNSTTGTSSTSTSPKTNEITMCCEEDEHQKILTIEPVQMSHRVLLTNNTTTSSHLNGPNHANTSFGTSVPSNETFMRNPAAHSSLGHANSNYAPSNQSCSSSSSNHNGIYGPAHGYINAMSSGSSVCASTALLLSNLNAGANSANTTQTNQNEQNNFLSELDFDEQDENDDEAEDFIVSTSSNLEFLKSQSLFSSLPLNYYPSLNLAASIKKLTQAPIEESPSFTETPPLPPISLASANSSSVVNSNTAAIAPSSTSTLASAAAAATANMASDYRFSTFLPPYYLKNNELV